MTLQVTTAVVGIVDNLVYVTRNQPSNPSTAIVEILEAFEAQITRSTKQGRQISVVEPNVMLKTTTVKPNKERKTTLSFAVRSTNNNEERFNEGDLFQVDNQNNKVREQKTTTSISFPAALFDVTGNGKDIKDFKDFKDIKDFRIDLASHPDSNPNPNPNRNPYPNPYSNPNPNPKVGSVRGPFQSLLLPGYHKRILIPLFIH